MQCIHSIVTQRPRHLVLISLSCLLCLFVVACDSTGSTVSSYTNPVTSTTSISTRLYVLDGTLSSPTTLRFVAFHPGDKDFTTLPAGLVSQDHQRIYTATPHGAQTTVLVTDVQTEKVIHSITLSGIYSTAGYDYTNAVISFDGHWLALRAQSSTSATSTFAFINTHTQQVETITLNGPFSLDAVSPDGSRIYLLQQLNDASGHYLVRLYNVNQHQLYPQPIADKSDINDPRMVGSGLTRVASSDGKRVYTLYIDTTSNIAFIHALPLANNFYLARCIDLPTGKSSQSATLLRYYTLALSADGSTLYATNAALGVSVAISVSDPDVFSDDAASPIRFTPTPIAQNAQLLHNGAVLSPDSSTLYVLGTKGITAISLPQERVQQLYATQQTFTGIALSKDGRTLYAAQPQDGITIIDVASGHTQKLVNSPAHAPWGIEWISG